MEKLQGKLNVLIRSCLVTLGVHEKAFSFLWHLKGHRSTARNTKQRGEQHDEIVTEEEHSHQQAESNSHENGTANTYAGRSEK